MSAMFFLLWLRAAVDKNVASIVVILEIWICLI